MIFLPSTLSVPLPATIVLSTSLRIWLVIFQVPTMGDARSCATAGFAPTKMIAMPSVDRKIAAWLDASPGNRIGVRGGSVWADEGPMLGPWSLHCQWDLSESVVFTAARRG